MQMSIRFGSQSFTFVRPVTLKTVHFHFIESFTLNLTQKFHFKVK